jgi:nicotinamidase-related amidase
MCVEAAVRAAHDLGFTCLLASDACATRALQFEEHIIPATNVHYSTLTTLQGSYARVATTEAIIREFSESDP